MENFGKTIAILFGGLLLVTGGGCVVLWSANFIGALFRPRHNPGMLEFLLIGTATLVVSTLTAWLGAKIIQRATGRSGSLLNWRRRDNP